jgi:hypothetical protein
MCFYTIPLLIARAEMGSLNKKVEKYKLLILIGQKLVQGILG